MALSETNASMPNDAGGSLIVMDRVTLDVPIINPSDRNVLSNPLRFLTDLYSFRNNRSFLTLLDGVSFTLEPAMRVGVLGGNGAGKSTLLRVLAGVYAPTKGSVQINGSIRGLFDLSLGMTGEATGLENIYMRGLQMGLSPDRIRELLPQVIEFSELATEIERPFGTYSTGMKLRLAFSISTMIKPDILLLDEWVGSGDARFREKVRQRMDQLLEGSRGMVLASHSASLIKRHCTHALVLVGGKVVFFGDVQEGLQLHKERMAAKSK